MKIASRRGHDVLDGVAANSERVGDKRTVAAPGNGFGAHNGAAFCFGSPAQARKFFETGNTSGEFGRLHVVGETSKAQIIPAPIRRIGASAAQAAEFEQMRVRNARAAKGLRKRVAIELRIVARARDGAHVDQALNIVRFEKREKFLHGAIGMADSENGQ